MTVQCLSAEKWSAEEPNIAFDTAFPFTAGGCGSVYLGVLYGVREVAIKVVNNPDKKQQARFVREIMMLKACHDPNIVQFLGAAIDKEQTLLVMTYMPGGDLHKQIASDKSGMFRWKQRYAAARLLCNCAGWNTTIAYVSVKLCIGT